MQSTFLLNTTNSTNSDTCWDICGDSLTPPISNMCDDGNTVSGDGCSSSCYIEAGYVCSYNVTTGGISKCELSQEITIKYLFS